MSSVWKNILTILFRILISSIFIISGVGKLVQPSKAELFVMLVIGIKTHSIASIMVYIISIIEMAIGVISILHKRPILYVIINILIIIFIIVI